MFLLLYSIQYRSVILLLAIMRRQKWFWCHELDWHSLLVSAPVDQRWHWGVSICQSQGRKTDEFSAKTWQRELFYSFAIALFWIKRTFEKRQFFDKLRADLADRDPIPGWTFANASGSVHRARGGLSYINIVPVNWYVYLFIPCLYMHCLILVIKLCICVSPLFHWERKFCYNFTFY